MALFNRHWFHVQVRVCSLPKEQLHQTRGTMYCHRAVVATPLELTEQFADWLLGRALKSGVFAEQQRLHAGGHL